MKIKIKDIAKHAGVSTGTVDRVLHSRGRVSAETRKKVLESMEELNYKPNILARTLAKQTVSKVSIVLPYPYQDFYWKVVRDGIVQSLADFWAYGIKGKIHFYDMFDPMHFEKTCEEILDDPADVIIIGSEFYRQTIDFLNECHVRNIKVIVLNAEINSAPSLSYIGINSFSLGLLTGRIIKSTRNRCHVLIVHVSENIKNSTHLKNKELGVIQSIGTEEGITVRSLTIPNPLPPPSDLLSLLKGIIIKDNIDTLYITTSKAYLFAITLVSIGFLDVTVTFNMCVFGGLRIDNMAINSV